MDRSIIDLYEGGGAKLRQAISNLTREDLLCRPEADAKVGKWSIQEVVIHLADCEQEFCSRMKRIIAEDNPTLLAFDENKWVEALHYDDTPAEDAVMVVELLRKRIANILRKLPESSFARFGTHNKRGKITLGEYVKSANEHLDHHLKFIHAKRAKMGKEMW